MMTFGYMRVSRIDQNLERQQIALQEYGCDRIFSEKESAVKTRPEFDKVLNILRKGDTLVIQKLTRLGRSVKDLIKLFEQFDEIGVQVVFLSDHIDTSTANGRFIFHMFAALAEFERDLLRERTIDGLRAARAKGHFAGRPKGLGKRGQRKAKAALTMERDKTISVSEICATLDISKSTYYRYVQWAKHQELEKKKKSKNK